MAITSNNTSAVPQVAMMHPFLMTYTDVTFTLDGTDQALAVAGTPHGGPAGAEPLLVLWERRAGTSNDAGVVHSVNVTNFDTTNDEVDYTFEVAAAGTSAETVIMRMWCIFLAARDKHEGVDTNAP